MGMKFQRECFCGEVFYSKSYRRTTCSIQCRTLQLYIRMLLKLRPDQSQRSLESIVLGYTPKQALGLVIHAPTTPVEPVLTEEEMMEKAAQHFAARKAAAPAQLLNRLAPGRRR